MIAETITVGITAIVLGSIWLADRVTRRYSPEAMLERDLAQETAAIAEKRRVIERDRQEWICSTEPIRDNPAAAEARNEAICACNQALLALADEEAKL